VSSDDKVTSQALRHHKSQGKEYPKKWIFRRGRDGVDVTWRGRASQVRAAVIGKARSATVDSRVRRTGSDDVDADRRRAPVPRSAGWNCNSSICLHLPRCKSEVAIFDMWHRSASV